ncbi:CRE-APH-2 protein [Caenorhabditis remanei]|uniref:Nicastrin n=1 Tax=Caenorhabditis remanei TaxID=31234 RepID=E3LUW2_CAERE|nr:CRE-APH-2 protein [Caenorhabditis remanei]
MKSWLAIVLLIGGVRCDGFSDQVFKTLYIGEGNACYRTFNKTHEFGCQATKENENGLIVRIDKQEDFENLESCWRALYPAFNGKFWALLPVNLIGRNTISLLKSSECLAGVILYNSPQPQHPEEEITSASHDADCPNAASDYYFQNKKEEYCERKINSGGSITRDGLMRTDWRIQMVFIDKSDDLSVIERCHSLFNIPKENGTTGYPYCGMSFRLANMAAGNSEICNRRGKSEAKLFQANFDSGEVPQICGAMHSDNIFAFPTPIPSSRSNETMNSSKYMMITSRMDSFGMIPEISVGEVSVLTSIISVIAAARSMGTQLEKWQKASNESNKNVFFAFFNGESLDYIGSGAAAYQMGKDIFPQRKIRPDIVRIHPIHANEIDYVLEVQQIGVSKGRKYYVHVDGERYDKNKTSTNKLMDRIERGLRSHGFDLEKLTDSGTRVPPASWHSFAKADPTVQSLLIAPFKEEYEYRRINSILDKNQWTNDEKEKAIQEIEAVATSILAASADYVGLETDDVVAKVDKALIATLFDCLIVSNFWFDCDFMKKLDGDRYHKLFNSYGFNEKSTYISMETHTAFPTVLHWLTIFALGSDKETLNVKSETSCSHLGEFQAMYTYTWQPSPYTGNFSCLKSSIGKKVMVSPAVDPYTPEEEMNTRYSTWMESVYVIESVNLYLMEDTSFEYTMLIIAVLSALLSMFAVGRCSESTFIVDEGEPAAEGGEPL